MLSDKKTYYKNINTYLENPKGRKELARFWKNELAKSLELNEPGRGVSVITSIDSFITGEDFLFFNNSISNLYALRSERGNISDFAMDFFFNNIDNIKKLFFKARDAKEAYYTLKLISNYILKKSNVHERHVLDLYIIYLYTCKFVNEYSEETRFYEKLTTLLLRGAVKYDFVNTARQLIKDKELSSKFNSNKAEEFNFNSDLTKYITAKIRNSVKLNNSPEYILSILVITDNYFSIISKQPEENKIAEKVKNERNKLFQVISSRITTLIDNADKVKILKNEIEHILINRVEGIEENYLPPDFLKVNNNTKQINNSNI